MSRVFLGVKTTSNHDFGRPVSRGGRAAARAIDGPSRWLYRMKFMHFGSPSPLATGQTPVATLLRAGLALTLFAPSAQASSQTTPSLYVEAARPSVEQPVVQPRGPSAGQNLNAALVRLSRDPQNTAALIDAGSAALQLGDSDAAIGFFTRANEVVPRNGAVKVQIAIAVLKSGQPFDAIGWFDQAESVGADPVAMASDRGLAYDLIGDNAAAQRQYQRALSRGSNEEATRRYALSLAIAGDRRAAESILAPQIQRQDRAAWRVRTFMVAILGDTDEAVGIAKASMPTDLAQGITPYLRYLPRLTPAQQAAAANLGKFPRAAEIGRDDPRIAQYALLHPRAPKVDSGLIPAGEALGGRGKQNDRNSRAKRGQDGRGSEKQIAALSLPARPSMPPPPPPPPPPAPLTAITPWGLQAAPRNAPSQGAAQSVIVPRPSVLSKLDMPPSAPRAAATERPILRAPLPEAPRALVAAPAAAPRSLPQVEPGAPRDVSSGWTLPKASSAETARTAPAVSTPVPVSLLQAPRAAMQEAAVPIVSDALQPTDSPPATPAFSITVARQAASLPLAASPPTSLLPITPQTPLAADPPIAAVPARAESFSSAFTDFKPPAEEQQVQVAAVDLTSINPTSLRSAKSMRSEALAATIVGKDGKVEKSKASKTAKDIQDAKAKSKNETRGERPDGPTSVSRISDAEKDPSDASPVKVTKGNKRDKDRKDSSDTKDSKGSKKEKSGLSHPSRIWAQVLTGANRASMVKEWRSLLRQAPGLRGRKPFTTPWRSNFRLLTGPFESDAAAQGFINSLRKEGVSGFQWTSPAGQAIDTLNLN